MAYAAAVAKYAGCTSPQQPIGLHKPLVGVRITLNPLLHLRRPLVACISETCLGLCGMRGGITSNAWAATNIVVSTVDQQDKSQGSWTGVAFWHGYGPRVIASSQSRLRGRGWCLSHEPLMAQSHGQCTAIPWWKQGCAFSHLHPGGWLYTSADL